MIWKVIYSDEARRDLRTIYLDEMPMRYLVCKEEPWHSKGVRVVLVDNYLIFYLPEEKSHAINILRIMYKGREINKKL